MQHSFLPLPPSLNASTPPRPSPGVTVSGPSSPLRPGSPTWQHSTSRGQPSLSPTSASFVHSPHTSSTHATGIQPSSQFFYPSRPNHFSRPSSAASSHNDHTNDHHLSSIQDNGEDFYQLDPLTASRRYSVISGEDGAADSTQEDVPHLERFKQSREPLLPVGSSRSQHPSISITPRDRNSSIIPAPQSPRKIQTSTTGRAVRTSFDRMLGLSRGMSLDSLRRKSMNSTRNDTPTSPRAITFDSKLPDEERGEGAGLYPLSPYKPSHSHSDFLHSPDQNPSPTPSTASPSPVPSFIPTPPADVTPLMHTPLRKPGQKRPGRFIRRYELHPSRNRFIFGGHLLMGGDSPWAFVGCMALMLGLVGLWFATTCVFWWRREGPGGKVIVVLGGYLAALVISSMLTTVGVGVCSFIS